MRARFQVARRLAVACLALVGIAAAVGCGGGGGGSSSQSNIVFTPGALKSVPLVRPPAPTLAALAVEGAPATPTSIDTDGFTEQLFKMQCRRSASEGVDYCPAGTPPRSDYGTALGDDPYQFDMQTLIGFIYHAQMYTSLVTSCSGAGLAPETVTAGRYQAASTEGADPTRFILDQYGTYACRSSQVSDPAHETRMVSAVADGSYQTTLHTRYQYVAGGETQTDFFQVDVSMDGAGSPELVAFNFASAAPFASRLVLLVNLTSHRFAMKYYAPQQPAGAGTSPERYAVAAGVAGYDLATGDPNGGHYAIHFQDDPGEFSECVDNATGAFEADFTLCDPDLDHAAWSPTLVGDFLGLGSSPTTADRLAPYLAVFGSMADLAIADGWSSTASGDQDRYWPASLN